MSPVLVCSVISLEVCEGSGLSAEIELDKVPRFDFLDHYIEQKSIPGGTMRNWDSYSSRIAGVTDFQKAILTDPQTSGGLLVAVEESHASNFEKLLMDKGVKANLSAD